MKRRRPIADTRPDWRDPNMIVYRYYLMLDGTLKTEVVPEYEWRYRQHMLESADALPWHSDPTYNLRRKR